jgi:hypothetical protein
MADLFKQIVPSILQTKIDHLQTEDDEKAYTGDAYQGQQSLILSHRLCSICE